MNQHGRLSRLACGLLTLAVLCAPLPLVAQSKIAVTTHHNDNLRTGWNNHESRLTPKAVSNSFGRLASVTLDDQVDAQPLVMPDQKIGTGSKASKHDVVYVATEGNTVYAIDATSGKILMHRNFGTPVSYPLGCSNNGPNVGINSTPVIDPDSGTMYVIIYTNESHGPVYRIHALSLENLKDTVKPVVVKGSHTLSDGTQFNFNATYQRQRPGLLLANGNIYAGFGSFCDFAANLSRGWLLGWQAGSLQPLSGNEIFDTQATSPDNFFLSSIWMSGYGLAADDAGDLFFVTGNSDYSGTTYDGVTNIQESVIRVSADLTQVLDLFTPDDWSSLDQEDADFGSGGALLLPPQSGSIPNLVVAAGKEGNMFLMNRDDLGGYDPTQNNVLGTYYIGGCWCGQSYYQDPSDSAARVVTSGGNTVGVWKLQTSPSIALTNISNAAINSGQFPGFFTSVSSDATKHPIIWALSRPYSNPPLIYLYAFNPKAGGGTLAQIFHGRAGSWPFTGGDSNQVPVVANGHVFVATYQRLAIFGLKGKQ